MSLYKAPDGSIHDDMDGQALNLLPIGSVCITEEEAKQIRPKYIPTYSQLRAAEYPPMQEYIDAIVKGDEAQKQAYIDACLAVKAKYPKA